MPDATGPVIEVTPGLLREWALPAHPHGGTKQARGQVLVVGGAVQTPGAVLLSAVASLRAGAGKLTVATVSSSATALGVAIPEALVQPLPETAEGAIDPQAVATIVEMAASANAVLVGPGMTDQSNCWRLLLPLLRQLGDVPVVLDALSLAVVEHDASILRELSRTAVLTPNRAELGYMLGRDDGEIGDSAGEAVCEAARRFGAVTSLGGGETLIADPDGRQWHESTGSIGLGVSGSGDCAAGIVAGLLARGADAAQAAVWGAHLHGRAGDRLAARLGRVGYLAREIADEIPQVLSMYD
jgi:ADP-dependent NAD(P)H-hydrate dehydratase